MGLRQVPSRKPAAALREKLPLAGRWWGKCVLLLLTIALLTFSFAPFKQFYLAWIGLVPWLIVLRWCRSPVTAFIWSWIAGVGFFIANMWWLAWVTGPGLIALMVVLGLYWGVAGAIIRGAALLGRRDSGEPVESWAALGSAALIAVVWVSLEWLRATWPLGGLPWLYLGHAQSPVLHLCQIADVTGVFGISFWVALINASAALVVLHRFEWRQVAPACGLVVLVLAGVLGYGVYRIHQQPTTPGPTVLAVQPNYPQDNTGEKSADPADIVAFHVNATREALRQHPHVDLVVWSETMMPALNPEARQFTQNLPSRLWQREAALMRLADEQITALAREFHTCLLVGGVYYDRWTINSKGMAVPQDRRNAAFLYTPQGRVNARYDKIHLVPFGEFLPFKSAVPPLYRLFLSMSPYPEEYTLTAGPPDAMTVFSLERGWRFVTPICFEDIDAALVHHMFEPNENGKRADFIVNITNDGWFKYNEMPQHLQAAVFRSIENRVPTARSVNTGISGFIDSVGRTSGLIPADSEGESVATLSLDSRLTFYTRFGDVFAITCAVLTALLTLATVLRSLAHRARQAPEKPDENTDRPNR
jgi:apolipoprotein N-acyltransferase